MTSGDSTVKTNDTGSQERLASHTPGPWTYEKIPPDQGSPSIMKEVFYIARPYGGFPGGEDEANARLIAAAPDLLAALEEIVTDGDYTAPEGMKRIARAAIAKAKGQA